MEGFGFTAITPKNQLEGNLLIWRLRAAFCIYSLLKLISLMRATQPD